MICYASTEGQTRKIAQYVTETVTRAGHKVVQIEADKALDLDMAHFDAVILAGSLHLGRYQGSLVRFIELRLEQLKFMPTAFISVSLSAASHESGGVGDASACTARLFDDTGWTANVIHQAAGALHYTSYGFLKRWVMRLVAMRNSAPTDTSQDVEFTDWDALRRFTGDFLDHAMQKNAA